MNGMDTTITTNVEVLVSETGIFVSEEFETISQIQVQRGKQSDFNTTFNLPIHSISFPGHAVHYPAAK